MWRVSDFAFDCVVVGAGPAGSTAAIVAQRAGLSTLLVDAHSPGRDKTCGDGLTPRAVHTLRTLGLEHVLPAYRNYGLKLHGFGGEVTAAWPQGSYGGEGSASPRAVFDAALVRAASAAGATVWQDCAATSADTSSGKIRSVTVTRHGKHGGNKGSEPGGEQYDAECSVRAKWVVVADGVRSPFGKLLGRRWHQQEVFGIAARSYCTSPFDEEPWMHSHVELRDGEHAGDGGVQPGYGWIFPLADGTVNLGCGALSTSSRPAKVNTKRLLASYAVQQRESWQLGKPARVTSALLPMGGAVSNVAGPNWVLIGDAAACVNPLNGEGIDYGMETATMAIELITRSTSGSDLTLTWPFALRQAYGDAFALARTAARLLTYPQFLPVVGPLGMRGTLGKHLMPAAARLMGNMIGEDDRDLIARAWRGASRLAPTSAPLWDVT